MKLRCVSLPDDSFWFDKNPITLGKIYDNISERPTRTATYVVNDAGRIQGYCTNRFKLLRELSPNIRIL